MSHSYVRSMKFRILIEFLGVVCSILGRGIGFSLQKFLPFCQKSRKVLEFLNIFQFYEFVDKF